MKRRTFLTASAATTLAAPSIVKAQGAWPNRPVSVVVPWGAGGGTDYHARTMATLLEREFRNPFTVVQRTGGSGVVGHSAIAEAAPDGYTIGAVTVEIGMMHWQGLTRLTVADYAPITLLNLIPAGVQVAANSRWQNLRQMVDDVRATPGRLKASGTGQGGIWHLALIGWLQAMGLRPDHVAWVPSNGAAPAMQDLAAGGVDIVTCSVPEAKAMIDAGRARSLAVMAPQRNPQFRDVPTLNEALGINYSVGAWRGIAAPKGISADINNTLVAALKKAYDSKEFQEFMANRGFGTTWADPAGFAAYMAEGDRAMGAAMTAAGLAKRA